MEENINEVSFAGMDSKKKPKLQRILITVCDVLGVDIDEVKGKSTKRELTKARHCYFYLARQASKHYSLEKIGELTNNHHSTVLCGQRKISQLMDVYQDEIDLINKIRKRLPKKGEGYPVKFKTSLSHVGYYDTPEKIKKLSEALNKKGEGQPLPSPINQINI
tara:strand:- start:520 stop:1008 length:489 start_codon:yes stop_codon:yes gene_type:complete